MNSRDRIEQTYRHEETDRVPTLFKNDGPILRQQLIKALEVEGRDAMLTRLGIDTRVVELAYLGTPPRLQGAREPPQGANVSHWGTITGTYSSEFSRPLEHVGSPTDLAGWVRPSPTDFDYKGLADQCAHYPEHAIVVSHWEPFFCGMCNLMGMEKALMTLALDAILTDTVIASIFEFAIEKTRRICQAVTGKAQVFYWGDDVAGEKGLLMGYDRWKRHFRKPMQRTIEVARDAGMHPHVHCCGLMREIIPDLIDMGVESLEPCQFHLPGMDAVELKREFGRHIVFFGGVNSQNTLAFGTPKDVRKETRSRIDVVGVRGGYVCGSDHSLLDDVPVDNVLAMYEEAGSYRR